jgi:hypothetical protein
MRSCWALGCLLFASSAWAGLTLDLRLDHPTRLEGETITARVGFMNDGTAPLTLTIPGSTTSYLLRFELRPEGSTVPLASAKFEGPGTGGDEVTLAAGERREADYDLTRAYVLLAAGRYDLAAQYVSADVSSDRVTTAVVITVPSGEDSDAYTLYRRAMLAAERTDVIDRAQALVAQFPQSRYRPLAHLLLLDNFRGLQRWREAVDVAQVLESEGGLSPGEQEQVRWVRKIAEDAIANGACDTTDQCDDGVGCTDDVCDAQQCKHTAVHARCRDANACNGTELCDPAHGCVGGTPIVCTDDGNVCTDDVCDPATGQCGRPNTAACDDGSPCTADRCADGACVSAAVGGYEGALCELDQLLATPPCGAEPLPQGLQHALAKHVAKAKPLLERARRATKPRKVAKALKGADRNLAAISAAIKRATKTGKTKLSATCAAALGDAVEHSRLLVRGLLASASAPAGGP